MQHTIVPENIDAQIGITSNLCWHQAIWNDSYLHLRACQIWSTAAKAVTPYSSPINLTIKSQSRKCLPELGTQPRTSLFANSPFLDLNHRNSGILNISLLPVYRTLGGGGYTKYSKTKHTKQLNFDLMVFGYQTSAYIGGIPSTKTNNNCQCTVTYITLNYSFYK